MRIPLPVPEPGRPSPRPRGRRLLAVVTAAATVAGTVLVSGVAPAAAVGGFSAGEVVVYRVGDGSATLSGSGAPVYLDEYSPNGTLLESVPLPTADAGAEHALVASGSAGSEGGLTLSADGRYLVATGYDTTVGTSGLSSSAAATIPRTIARVDGSGDVDTTTALTDFADGNNPRSAVSADGSEFWVGGAAGGVRYAALGASTSTSLVGSTYKNVRQLEIVDGQLYASADPTKASVTVATVGTGLPTTGTQTVTNLPFSSSPVEPYGYSLLTLGTGTTPDTLYVADNSEGAVVKYGLSGGKWVQQGSVLVSGITGLTANDSSGVVTVYATSSGANGTAGTLYKITDASGIGGELSGSAAVLASAPGNETFRGLAFAPGTVIGTGGGTAPTSTAPTISTAHSGLPAALGDPTNPTLGVTVGDTDFPAADLSVTATSSDQAVAPSSGITLTGSGADQTLTVTPGSAGYSTITLTVTAPDGTSASTQIQYGVSANLGDPSQRYFSGAGNGSTAIDVGGGYMIVGDDEVNVLHLYNETQSGPPVASFDFTGELPYGTTSVDIESSARSGDMLYWDGSMTNSSSGDLDPSRSTLFAAKITGSGANTQLSYVGSYTDLKGDLVSWDENNGSGLGANYFGFAASTAAGVDSHDADALDVEGMEFAPGSGDTAYLAFRAPLEPTSARDLALIIPLTNINELVDGTASSATFGAPIMMNLGGLGIREIRKNADGQYLIIAGTPDGTNSSFVLYSWDGNPSDPPLASSTALPLEPAGANEGSWETIVDVPDPLTAGSGVQLLQDDGDTAWYGDTLTSKTGLNPDLQKDLSQVFTYAPGTLLVTTTALSAQPSAPAAGQAVTFTATVTGPSGTLGTPTGTVEFTDGTTDLPGCSAIPVDSTGTATCTTTYSAAGSETALANYSGDSSFAASASAPLVVQVNEPPLAVDQTITQNGTGTVTTAPFTTTGPRLLVAYVGADGPAAVQSATVTGGGLTWTLVQRADAKTTGTAEIWTAQATGPLTAATVTSTLKIAGYDQSLTVVAYSGAAGVGASASAGKSKGAPSVSLTTTKAGSWVFGVGEDYSKAVARTLGSGQSLVNQWVDSPPGETFWVQGETAATPAAGTVVTVNDTAPTADIWNLAVVEILPLG
jgi:Bacterial Ig-like domain (group 3)